VRTPEVERPGEELRDLPLRVRRRERHGQQRVDARLVAELGVDRELPGDRLVVALVRADAVDPVAGDLTLARERVGRDDLLGGAVQREDLGVEALGRDLRLDLVPGDRPRAREHVLHLRCRRVIRRSLALLDVPAAVRVVRVLIGAGRLGPVDQQEQRRPCNEHRGQRDEEPLASQGRCGDVQWNLQVMVKTGGILCGAASLTRYEDVASR